MRELLLFAGLGYLAYLIKPNETDPPKEQSFQATKVLPASIPDNAVNKSGNIVTDLISSLAPAAELITTITGAAASIVAPSGAAAVVAPAIITETITAPAVITGASGLAVAGALVAGLGAPLAFITAAILDPGERPILNAQAETKKLEDAGILKVGRGQGTGQGELNLTKSFA